MKKFVLSVLSVAVFFVGLGAIVEKAGAKFKSDEKALDIVRKARVAIGGDAAIAEVRSMTIVGRTTHTFKVDGAERSEQGESEIAMQFPDKFSRTMKIGKDDGSGLVEKSINRQVDVVVVGDAKDKIKVLVNGEGHGEGAGTGVAHKIIIKKDDGTVKEMTGEEAEKWIAAEHPDGAVHTITLRKKADGTVEKVDSAEVDKVILRKADGGNVTWSSKDGKTIEPGDKDVMFERSARGGSVHAGGMKQNELLRLTLALLLTAPEGIDVNYTFVGESDVDGTAVNIINAEFGGAAYKLYIGKSSNLPLAMSCAAMEMPHVVTFTKAVPAPADGTKDTFVFNRKIDAGEKAEQFVRFSDYRSTGGVQLPYLWTTTIGGGPSEVFDVTAYEINPANIAEKFANQKVFVRTAKPTN